MALVLFLITSIVFVSIVAIFSFLVAHVEIMNTISVYFRIGSVFSSVLFVFVALACGTIKISILILIPCVVVLSLVSDIPLRAIFFSIFLIVVWSLILFLFVVPAFVTFF